jgi:uncharacterized protein YwqG
VFWFPNAPRLRRVRLPAFVPEHGRFKAGRIALAETLSIPPYQAVELQKLGMSQEEDDAYFALWEERQSQASKGTHHQFLGHAKPVQDDMRLECQLVSHGIYCGSPEGYSDPRRSELERDALHWRLLAQIDSDDSVEMTWGVGGMLYYWITISDLASRQFDRSWTILQTT